MQLSDNICRPCLIMTGFTFHQLCFLKSLFRLYTQGCRIALLERMQLVIVGFHNLLNDVGASKNIILLKEKEYDPLLLQYIEIENIDLLRKTIAKKYESTDAVDDNIHIKLTKFTRGVDGKSNRFTLKKELAELYLLASEGDEKIIDIYLNCLNKLPNFKKTEEVSEMELTINYLDSILSPIFHDPEKNKHLLWLNRKEENTSNSRPDGSMKYYDQKVSGVTLGYCEVKPSDAQRDDESLCTDLVRLALLSQNVMKRKENKIACTLQAVGSHCSFYVLNSICEGITVMNEIISFDIPMEIKELGNLNTIADDLKKMHKVYDKFCQKRYSSDLGEDGTNIASIVKPKRRKRVTDLKPITFN